MNRRIKRKMKMRAILLIAILIGGTFEIIRSFNEYNEKAFHELIDSNKVHFSSLVFTKPSSSSSSIETWKVIDDNEINELMIFLQNYNFRKLKPSEVTIKDVNEYFSISLEDQYGKQFTIIIEQNLIIQNTQLYYEIVDGPLDAAWLAQFYISNQL